jgi:UDP-glucose 4-epimerase
VSAKRALVTGAAGFVGANLTRRLLAEGHEIHVLQRPGSDDWRLREIDAELVTHLADLRDQAAVESAVRASAPDWIFHLAAHGAYSWQKDSRGIFESNLMGTMALAEACVAEGFEAFVHAGSSSEYGAKDHAPSEEEAPAPNSDYAVAKASATLLCRYLRERSGLRITTLRLYSVYGPWEDPRRLMPTLVVHGLDGTLPPLVDPDTARDFVHVDDVCDAFLLAAATPVPQSSGIYNVGSGIQSTLREVVEAARAVLGIAAEPSWGSHRARAWDTDVWVADPRKIERELGWRSKREPQAGIESLRAWLEVHRELLERYRLQSASAQALPPN